MRIFFIFIFYSLISISGRAQHVKVVDQDLFPIEGVQASLKGAMIGLSNPEGIIAISPGQALDSILFSHPGYHAKKMLLPDIEHNVYTIVLFSRTAQIDGIVVTPGRVERLRNDLAISIDIIKADEILKYQPQTSADLLSLGNKVYIQKSQMGGGSPMIRGFATNRILLVVDDVRMNTAIFRSGNVQNVISIDPFTIEETEVIFGPGSQFYGSDAVGGVLSFNTLSPKFADSGNFNMSGQANIRFASANTEKTWHVHIRSGWKKFAMVNSLSFSQFGNLVMGNNGPEAYTRPDVVLRDQDRDTIVKNPNPNKQLFTAYRQFNTMHKFKMQASTRLNFQYTMQLSYTSDIPRYDRLILRDDQDLPVNAEWYYGPQVWWLNQLKTEYKANTHLFDLIKINFASQFFEESRHDRRLYSVTRRDRKEQVEAYSINIDLEKRLKHRIRLNYGAEYILNLISSTASTLNVENYSFGTLSTRYPNGSKWQAGGVYVNIFKRFNNWYKVEAGSRYSVFQMNGRFDSLHFKLPIDGFDIQNSALTGSIAHLFSLSNKLKIGLITSTAFRAPNIDDVSKVFDSSPGTVIMPNTSLKPEYAYSAELTVDYKPMSKIQLYGTMFITHLSNALVQSKGSLNGKDSIIYDGVLSEVRMLSNDDYAKVYGSQLSVEYGISEALTFRSDYTFLNSTSQSGEPIRHITPNFGGSHLIYSNNKLMLDFYGLYNQEFPFSRFTTAEASDVHLYASDENGRPYSPAWFTLNLRCNYSFQDRYAINLGMENILNRRYRPYASGLSAPGINGVLALSARF